jgi:hypothetical protein
MEREQYRRELQPVRSQCGDAQVRIDLLMKAESLMEQQNDRLLEEIRSGSYLASEATVESSDRLLRAQLQVKDLERQVREFRHAEVGQQRMIESLQKTVQSSMEQSAAAKVFRGPGGPEVDRLRKDVSE